MVMPGEYFRKDYDEAAEKRLIGAGAIRKADAPVSHGMEAETVIQLKESDAAAQEAEDSGNAAQHAEDEADDVMEPPTVDVEDAVVTAPKPAKNKVKKGGEKK